MSHTDLELKAYEIIDDFLGKLQVREIEFFSTYGKSQEYFIAKEIIDRYKLISYRVPSSKMSIVDITTIGLKVLSNGGIQKFIDSELDQLKSKADKESLELAKLRSELDLLQNQLLDYDQTKERSKRSERIAIISIIVTVLLAILQLAFSKP